MLALHPPIPVYEKNMIFPTIRHTNLTAVALLCLLSPAALSAVSADEIERETSGGIAQEQNAAAEQAGLEKAAPTSNQYVRLLRENGPKDDDGAPTALQTSICRFQSQDGNQQVDLIGAVHVGERSYYEELNRLFTKYDAILYELVAPEGTRIPKGGGEAGGSAIGYLQTGMTQMLELAYQLQEIDYTVANFVHADMTPEEFAESMKRRKESAAQMFFRAIGQSLVQQAQTGKLSSDAEMMTAIVSENRTHALRVVLANQFADLDGAALVFGGPDGSTLITERNKKALNVLKKQLAAGKRRVGIFYGAGHLKDMAKRLEEDFGMRSDGHDWLTAWDLRSDSEREDAP